MTVFPRQKSKMWHRRCTLAAALALACAVQPTAGAPPGVILHILIDDLGWGDVGWHRNASDNQETPTPHMSGGGFQDLQAFVQPTPTSQGRCVHAQPGLRGVGLCGWSFPRTHPMLEPLPLLLLPPL
jgi:hypothetical protein